MKNRMVLAAALAVLVPLAAACSNLGGGVGEAAPAASTKPASPQVGGKTRIVVTDPTGEVTGSGPRDVRKVTDVTGVIYKVAPYIHNICIAVVVVETNGGIRRSPPTAKSLLNGQRYQRAVTEFTAGRRQYRVSYDGIEGHETMAVKDGREWVSMPHVWFTSTSTLGELYVTFSLDAIKNASVYRDLRTVLRVGPDTTLSDRVNSTDERLNVTQQRCSARWDTLYPNGEPPEE